jgi:hypothetical protein
MQQVTGVTFEVFSVVSLHTTAVEIGFNMLNAGVDSLSKDYCNDVSHVRQVNKYFNMPCEGSLHHCFDHEQLLHLFNDKFYLLLGFIYLLRP